MNFDGILFFPVTPFGGNGAIDHDLLAQHVERGVAAGSFEYRGRRDAKSRNLSRSEVLALFA